MLNVSRPGSVRLGILHLFTGVFFCLGASAAFAQAPNTPLERKLSHFELGISAVGEQTFRVSGTVTSVGQGTPNPTFSQSEKASTTVGFLGNIRYTKSPLIGVELNFNQARYTENFTAIILGGAQTKSNEYSAGYLAHLHSYFGFDPFAGGGVGAMAFHPTVGGGLGLPQQLRFAYYYNLGVDHTLLSEHFGARVQFRQVFYTAPDFLQNYLTINKWTSTLEPGIGFYLKF